MARRIYKSNVEVRNVANITQFDIEIIVAGGNVTSSETCIEGEECELARIDIVGHHSFAVLINPRGREVRIPIKTFEDYFHQYTPNIINQ